MYCTPDDVRIIIDTGLEDSQLNVLIEAADAEIDERDLDLTSSLQRIVSMLFTASLASLNDTSTRAAGDYEGRGSDYRSWRNLAEEQIKGVQGVTGRCG